MPLDGEAGYGEVAGFAHRVGRLLVSRHPERLTQEFYKADRGRADPGRHRAERVQRHVRGGIRRARKTRRAVSAPCTWEEVERGDAGPRTFTLRTMGARIAAVGELGREMPGEAAVAARRHGIIERRVEASHECAPGGWNL